MKNFILFLFLLSTGLSGMAQSFMNDDTLVVSNNSFYKGQKLKLGRPVNDRDFFTYVTGSKAVNQMQTYDDSKRGNQTSNGFGKDYAGRNVIIKKIVKDGNKEFGYKYFLVVKTSGVLNAWIDVENAIETKELLLENY